MANDFETKTCSRCGGCGRYSYNQISGDRCFGCGGRGKQYTRRGSAAVAYLRTLRTFPAEAVQVGWLKYNDGFMGGKRAWYAITAIRTGRDAGVGRVVNDETIWDGIAFVTRVASFCVNPGEQVADVVPSNEYLQESRAKALAYQDSLTQAGTVRKSNNKNGE